MTFISTSSAYLCAFLTMIHISVSFTFLSTRFANICTNIAYLFWILAIPWHGLWGCPTNIGTISVNLDTGCHGLYILFLQVTSSTIFTCFGTTVASVNTGSIFLILKCSLRWHNYQYKTYYLYSCNYLQWEVAHLFIVIEDFSKMMKETFLLPRPIICSNRLVNSCRV
jgi:hypothetical protein